MSDIGLSIVETLRQMKDDRHQLEQRWTQSWAEYLGTPNSSQYLRTQVATETPNNWRHKINKGKAFQIVETQHAYLFNASFPNDDWIYFEPANSGYAEVARLVTKYFKDRLYEAKYVLAYSNFLRQMLICGQSCMAMPWVKGNIDYRVLSVYETFFNPEARDRRDSPFIRLIYKPRYQVLADARKYRYDLSIEEIKQMDNLEHFIERSDKTLKMFQGLDITHEQNNWTDSVGIIEYWGDIYNNDVLHEKKCITVIGGKVVKETSFDVFPFVVGDFIEVTQSPYGIGALHPVLGAIKELNDITNARLDNLSVSSSQMFTYIDDGMLKPEDIVVEPGKVIPVADHDAIRPMQLSTADYNISYTESQFLDADIDKVAGIGPLVGATMRSGERVTAEEVSSVREMGGNRLTSLFMQIEMTSFLEIMHTSLELFRKYGKDHTVKVKGGSFQVWEYYAVGKEELQLDWVVKPRGAGHVLERQRKINLYVEFLQLVSSNEQFAQRVDFEQLLMQMLEIWGFDDPDSLVLRQQGGEQTPLQQMGGAPMQQMATEQIAADGGRSLMASMGAQLPEGVGIADVEQQLNGAAATAAAVGIG